MFQTGNIANYLKRFIMKNMFLIALVGLFAISSYATTGPVPEIANPVESVATGVNLFEAGDVYVIQSYGDYNPVNTTFLPVNTTPNIAPNVQGIVNPVIAYFSDVDIDRCVFHNVNTKQTNTTSYGIKVGFPLRC